MNTWHHSVLTILLIKNRAQWVTRETFMLISSRCFTFCLMLLMYGKNICQRVNWHLKAAPGNQKTCVHWLLHKRKRHCGAVVEDWSNACFYDLRSTFIVWNLEQNMITGTFGGDSIVVVLRGRTFSNHFSFVPYSTASLLHGDPQWKLWCLWMHPSGVSLNVVNKRLYHTLRVRAAVV